MKICSLILTILLFATFANAMPVSDGGNDHGNGGDMCENRFKNVRDDLRVWIEKGGSLHLQLPEKLSHEQYVHQMLEKIENAQITCVERKIRVNGVEKTCKNFAAADGTLLIQCNRNQFMTTSESDQYILVHHEYAGLTGFEVTIGDSSNYEISNQITGFLENQVVKKLVINPVNRANDPFSLASCEGPRMSLEDSYNLVPIDSQNNSFAEFTIHTRTRWCDRMNNCNEWIVTKNEVDIINWGFQPDLGFHELQTVEIPSRGIGFFSPAEKDTRFIAFRTAPGGGNNLSAGILIDCGTLNSFRGTCLVSTIPTLRTVGDAFGFIGQHCSRLTLEQKHLHPDSSWNETEIVFLSKY